MELGPERSTMEQLITAFAPVGRPLARFGESLLLWDALQKCKGPLAALFSTATLRRRLAERIFSLRAAGLAAHTVEKAAPELGELLLHYEKQLNSLSLLDRG